MELPCLLWPTSFAMAVLSPFLLFFFKPKGVVTGLALALLLLPPYFLLLALPRSPSIRGLLSFPLCWIIPNRLLLLCFHNSASLNWPAWSLSCPSHFMLSILLPVRLKGPSAPSAHLAPHLRILLYELLALLCMAACLIFTPPHASYPFFFLFTFLIVDLPSRIAAIPFHILYGMDLHAAFNNPWLPYSLTEFWGHHWNLTANALLRQSVYDPIVAHLSARGVRMKDVAIAAGKEVELWVRVVGVCATFLCSGLIHELMWFCIFQKSRPSSWENTWFFVLHGLATSAEISFRRLLPHLFQKIPRFIKLGVTLAFVHTTMAWLLFAPQRAMPREF